MSSLYVPAGIIIIFFNFVSSVIWTLVWSLSAKKLPAVKEEMDSASYMCLLAFESKRWRLNFINVAVKGRALVLQKKDLVNHRNDMKQLSSFFPSTSCVDITSKDTTFLMTLTDFPFSLLLISAASMCLRCQTALIDTGAQLTHGVSRKRFCILTIIIGLGCHLCITDNSNKKRIIGFSRPCATKLSCAAGLWKIQIVLSVWCCSY